MNKTRYGEKAKKSEKGIRKELDKTRSGTVIKGG